VTYLLDSNTFIQAKNDFYRFSFCPGYWDWIIDGYHRGQIFSTEHVRQELLHLQDDLAKWITSFAPKGMFIKTTDASVKSYAAVVNWVSNRENYKQEHKDSFLGGADPWLIAEALAGNHIIVTFEKSQPDSAKVKIPDVAQGFGVPTLRIYDVIEQTGRTLTLA
jgi:hypothetical protein